MAEKRMSKAEVAERLVAGIYHTNPELLALDGYGIELDPWQKRAIRKLFLSPKKRLSVRACHNAGKTFLSGLITNMFLVLYAPSLVCITGPTGNKQTRLQVWSYVARIHEMGVFHDDFEWLKTKMIYKGGTIGDSEKWYATWVSSKNPKTIEGFHGPVGRGENLLWILEESKAIEDSVLESLSGAISADNCFLYVSSTCGAPRGFFYRSHTTQREMWEVEHVPHWECPRLPKAQVDDWKRQWGEDSAIFKARIMAEFPNESEYAIANLSWLERAVGKNKEEIEENDIEAA